MYFVLEALRSSKAALDEMRVRFTLDPESMRPMLSRQLQRDTEMRMQLANRDEHGMTLAMIAARSKNVAITASVMSEIEQTEVRTTAELHIENRFRLHLIERNRSS